MTTATVARTDEQIQKEVLAELKWAEKQGAERAAWSAPGVTAVDNRITISF